jgi:hypothetical protein
LQSPCVACLGSLTAVLGRHGPPSGLSDNRGDARCRGVLAPERRRAGPGSDGRACESSACAPGSPGCLGVVYRKKKPDAAPTTAHERRGVSDGRGSMSCRAVGGGIPCLMAHAPRKRPHHWSRRSKAIAMEQRRCVSGREGNRTQRGWRRPLVMTHQALPPGVDVRGIPAELWRRPARRRQGSHRHHRGVSLQVRRVSSGAPKRSSGP